MFVNNVTKVVAEYTDIPLPILVKSRESDCVNARRQVVGICREYGRSATEIRRVLKAYSDNDAVYKAYAAHLDRIDPGSLAFDAAYMTDYSEIRKIVCNRYGEPGTNTALTSEFSST